MTATTYTITLTPAQVKAMQVADAWYERSYYENNPPWEITEDELDSLGVGIDEYRGIYWEAMEAKYDRQSLTLVSDSWLENDIIDKLEDSASNITGGVNGPGHCRAAMAIVHKILDSR